MGNDVRHGLRENRQYCCDTACTCSHSSQKQYSLEGNRVRCLCPVLCTGCAAAAAFLQTFITTCPCYSLKIPLMMEVPREKNQSLAVCQTELQHKPTQTLCLLQAVSMNWGGIILITAASSYVYARQARATLHHASPGRPVSIQTGSCALACDAVAQ